MKKYKKICLKAIKMLANKDHSKIMKRKSSREMEIKISGTRMIKDSRINAKERRTGWRGG